MKLKDRVVLVTGGARGQGRSHCNLLAKEGAKIITLDIIDMSDTVSDVKKIGQEILAISADVRDYDAVKTVVNESIKKFGKIDIIVNNAGLGHGKPFDEITNDEWDEMLDTNLKGVWHCCKAIAPHFKERNDGKIINISSVEGNRGTQNLAHYCASKFGVIALTKTLAIELAPYNVKVNAVCPGTVRTNMLYTIAGELKLDPEVFAETTLLNKILDPIEISNAVLFFASDESNYITGQTLIIDAGRIVK